MSQSYKVNPTFVSTSNILKRHQIQQFNFAYFFETKNELYKPLQKKLYKLGYECEINGNLSKENMRDALKDYGTDKYKMTVDYEGITFYTLYNLMFNISSKIKVETEIYNNEEKGNDYSILYLKGDYDKYINSKQLIILNALDSYGMEIIEKLCKALDYYNTNYLIIKQYDLPESMKDIVNRIKDVSSRKNVIPIVFNIGNAYDYSLDKNKSTLLRGVNVYYNQGLIYNDIRKTQTYIQYFTRKVAKNLSIDLEYVRIEENVQLPILKDLGSIPTFQIEIGYTNNPIDKVIIQNKTFKLLVINTLCHAIQRVTSYKDSLRYAEFTEESFDE